MMEYNSFLIPNRAVDLPFIWVIIKPDFREKPNEVRIRDVDTRFTIKPETGLLLAKESMTFLLAFAPPAVSEIKIFFSLSF